MILDNIEALGSYSALLPELETVLEWLRSGKLLELPDGKHLLSGERLYVNIGHSSLGEWEDKRFEGHRRYADVQCVLSGREIIGFAPADRLETAAGYDAESDLVFFRDREECSARLALEAGMAAVFFPADAHKPGCICGGSKKSHKAVFKVLIK